MATVIINERTAKGKSLLEFLRKFEGENFIRIDKEPNKETKRAIRGVKETKYLMSSPETMAAIRRGEEDLKKGDVYTQNPDESINAFLKRISCTD
ncbi:MAG: hypothetical protein AB2L24_13525 [Mangrovibacterium sp.]